MNTKAITLAKRVTKSSVLPVLDNVLLNQNGDITYSNLDITVTHKKLFPKVDSNYLIALGSLDKVSKAFKSGFEISISDNLCTFSDERKSSKVALSNPDDFPVIPEMGEVISIVGSRELKKAALFCGSDDLRPQFTGVYLGKKGLAATDTNKLYYNTSHSSELDSIISKEAINCILDDRYVNIGFSKCGSYIFIDNDEQTIFAHIIEATFPDFTAVIPEDCDDYFYADVKNLIKSVNEVLPFANKDTSKIAFGNGSLSANDLDFGHEIVLDMNLGSIKEPFGVNAKLLLQCLKSLECDSVMIQSSAPNRAIKIGSNVILMPVMLNY